jgi:hypothetical protein
MIVAMLHNVHLNQLLSQHKISENSRVILTAWNILKSHAHDQSKPIGIHTFSRLPANSRIHYDMCVIKVSNY